MSDFNVKVTVRNAHLLRAIRARHETIADFCRAADISQSAVSAILTFKAAPFKRNGDLTKAAETICSYLGKYPGELWPAHVARLKARKSRSEVELSEAEMTAICGNQESRVIQRELIARWAKNLSPRQIEAIGIYQSGGTLEDIGSALGVSRERGKQIMNAGLRKMRNAAKIDRVNCVSDVIDGAAA